MSHMITKKDLTSLAKAARLAGFNIEMKELELSFFKASIETHIREKKPEGFSAIYIFEYKKKCLKVGKAGLKSNARFCSHHYYTSSKSSLANSLLKKDSGFASMIGKQKPKTWIIENTNRYNILIPENYDKFSVNFAEAFFILKCKPEFESFRL